MRNTVNFKRVIQVMLVVDLKTNTKVAKIIYYWLVRKAKMRSVKAQTLIRLHSRFTGGE